MAMIWEVGSEVCYWLLLKPLVSWLAGSHNFTMKRLITDKKNCLTLVWKRFTLAQFISIVLNFIWWRWKRKLLPWILPSETIRFAPFKVRAMNQIWIWHYLAALNKIWFNPANDQPLWLQDQLYSNQKVPKTLGW